VVKGILGGRKTGPEKEHQKHDRAKPEVDGSVTSILALHSLPLFKLEYWVLTTTPLLQYSSLCCFD
jgi:hypothetical protein